MNTKRIIRIIALVMAILLFLGLVVTPALASAATVGDSSSIGVIGSADGPTVIFVATSPGGIVSVLLLIAAAVFATVFIIKKRRK